MTWRTTEEQGRRPISVLVADDEHLVATDIAMSLEEEGFRVIGPASNGAQAVALARVHAPDVCLLDIRMPELDGVDAAATIKKELGLTVVMLSAYSDDESVVRASAAGADGFIVKPASAAQLRAAIHTAAARNTAAKACVERVSRLERQLESRKLVERAKWSLVSGRGMTEPEAHLHLQRLAREQRRKVEEVAAELAGAGV